MKSRLLITVLVVALAATVIGGATMAWFTDSDVAEEVTFTAGTLMINVDNPEYKTLDVNLDRLNPGDCMEWQFDVENVGNKSANWLLYMCYQDIIGQENDGLCADQPGLLEARDFGTDPLSDVLLWTIKVGEQVVMDGETLSAKPMVFDDLTAFAAPADCDDKVLVNVTVKACLPEEAGNEYQGGAMEIVFGAHAWQTTHGATFDGEIECPWGHDEYLVSVTADPTGGGSVDGAGSFAAGDNVTVVAVAIGGYTFQGWYEDGTHVSDNLSHSFIMPAHNVALVANFEEDIQPPPEYELTLKVKPNCPSGVGTVTGGGNYEEGTTVNVTAVVNKTGYKFVNWTEGTDLVSEEASFDYTMPGRDVTLTANFEKIVKKTVKLNINPSKLGVSNLSGGGNYEVGDSVTVTAPATIKTGFIFQTTYYFQNWTVNFGSGISGSSNSEYTFTMPDRDVTLTANYYSYY